MKNANQGRCHELLTLLGLALLLFTSRPLEAATAPAPEIMHPMMHSKIYAAHRSCPNCGMSINMWARTRHTFENEAGEFETCSIRCLADLSAKMGELPANAMVALYLEPTTMVPAAAAFYVVGSSAAGTMTMNSKIAFASAAEAAAFAGQYGGTVKGFAEVTEMAAVEAEESRATIQANRLKKGKITEPPADSTCTSCGMPPAKFPKNRAQVTTKNGEHLHFCSTKCLVSYLENPGQLKAPAPEISAVWVTAHADGDYEYANGMHYLVGSRLLGPMGPEAIPFRSKAAAEAMARQEGGRVVRWPELKAALIGGQQMRQP